MNSYSIKQLIRKNPCTLIFVCCAVLLSVLLPELVSAQTYVPLTEIPGFKDAAASGSFSDLINVIYKMAIGIGSIMAVFMIIWAGVQYMTSTNASNMQGLKEKILGALGGLVFLLAAFALLSLINSKITSLSVSELDKASLGVADEEGEGELPSLLPGESVDGDPTEINPRGADESTENTTNPIFSNENINVRNFDPDTLYEGIMSHLPASSFIDPSKIFQKESGTAVTEPFAPQSPGKTEELNPVEEENLMRVNNNDKQLRCMAANMYYEAAGEPTAGQEMVAHVTWNRVKAKEFPSTVCGVVYQHKQFSWTLEPAKRNKIPNNQAKMSHLLAIAQQVMFKDKKAPSPLNKSCIKYYKRTDNKWVSNRSRRWFQSRLSPKGSVGAHTFYCAKGES